MKLIGIIATVVFVGFAYAGNEPIRAAASSKPNVTHGQFSQMPFVPLTQGEERIEEITPQTPAFEFKEGLSYFKAYSIATSEREKLLKITTYIVGASHMPSAFVFYPHITFLDEHFTAVSDVDPKLSYKNNFWNSERSGWQTEISVPSTARYAVIHSPTSKRGERIYYKDSSDTPTGTVMPVGKGAMYVRGNWWDVYLPGSGSGRFQIELQ